MDDDDEVVEKLLPETRSHDVRKCVSWPWILALSVAMAWIAFVSAMRSQDWVVLHTQLGFRNLGEEHDFELELGLWDVTYHHTVKKRLNVVRVDSLSGSVGEACDATGLSLAKAACAAVLAARRYALLALCCASAVDSLLLLPKLLGRVLGAVALASVFLALCAWASVRTIAGCAVDDLQAQAEIVTSTTISAMACNDQAVGTAPLLFFLAACLHAVGAGLLRAPYDVPLASFRLWRLLFPTR